MKKSLCWVGSIVMISAWNAVCFAESTSPEIAKSLKATSNEPNFFSIVFALLFVIFLIYITGVIYSKLNLVGAKTVKEQLRGHQLDRAVVISTTQLGQGRNLHVIEVNKTRLLVGASTNSINLIKELGKVTDEKEDVKPAAQAANDVTAETLQLEEESQVEEKFDIHKKYL